MIRALSAIASAHFDARSKARTAAIISQLPELVQKDIGWRWTPSRNAQGSKSIDWDLM